MKPFTPEIARSTAHPTLSQASAASSDIGQLNRNCNREPPNYSSPQPTVITMMTLTLMMVMVPQTTYGNYDDDDADQWQAVRGYKSSDGFGGDVSLQLTPTIFSHYFVRIIGHPKHYYNDKF